MIIMIMIMITTIIIIEISNNSISNTANNLCTAKPANKVKLGTSAIYSMQKSNHLVVALASFHGLNKISDQYLHGPAKVSRQHHLSRVLMKQIGSVG